MLPSAIEIERTQQIHTALKNLLAIPFFLCRVQIAFHQADASFFSFSSVDFPFARFFDLISLISIYFKLYNQAMV